ncbi:MAG: hypothetical protein FJX03_00605 [Alphaproteobacteria bacterium]|nr:hypothetical protein [Alphaproteobacteria bacterium]
MKKIALFFNILSRAIVVMLGFMMPLCANDVDTQEIEKFKNHYLFKKFMSRAEVRLNTLQKAHMPQVQSVFYPFGGADLLYPLLLFPDAKIYVLVGLETLGAQLSDETIHSAFQKLDSLLRRSFFVTSTMAKSFNKNVGVRSILELQIRLLGGKILDDASLVSSDPNCLNLTFEWQGQTKTVYYLKKDLTNNLDNLFDFLTQHNVVDACMFKSSSYCPHQKLFSDLKKRILCHFSYIVQDDTGIPLKNLTDFDVEILGRYTSPYGVEFSGFQQNDLKEMYAERKNIPPLNFCFGYGCGRVQANLLVAHRKASNSANIMTQEGKNE